MWNSYTDDEIIEIIESINSGEVLSAVRIVRDKCYSLSETMRELKSILTKNKSLLTVPIPESINKF